MREPSSPLDAEVFTNPTDIIPMGGGYDWRCFVNPRHGVWFLCKDGLPLRDSSPYNRNGWRVCAVEIGQDESIRKFAAYFHKLQSQIEEPRSGDDNAALIKSAQALLDLDASGALVPHGIGSHARTLIEAFIERLPVIDYTRDPTWEDD